MKFNVWTFLFEVINFVVLAYILYRLLYRPLHAAIDQRRAATAQAQTEAHQAKVEAEAIQMRLQTELTEVEQHRQEAIHQAREQAESERRKLLAETEQALQQRRDETRQAMEHEREEALKSLHAEVIAQAIDLTQRLLREASEQTLHQQLARRLVQTLNELPDAERTTLQSQLHSGDGIVLETAQELDGAMLEQFKHAVTSLTGNEASLAVQTQPALLGGVRLRVGGQVWDGSLAGQLQDATR